MAFPQEAAQVDLGNRTSTIDSSTYVRAIASFERELVTRNSAYDRYVMGDDKALTEQQISGLGLFFGKAKCGNCHSGSMFSDFKFKPIGVPQEGTGKSVIAGDDTGREEFTKDPADRYAFRTPTLRNIEITPPYMHDGVFETLEQVMEFYDDGAIPRHSSMTVDMLSEELQQPLLLEEDEIDAIIAFLKALTDDGSLLPAYLLQVPVSVPSGLPPVFGVKDAGYVAMTSDGRLLPPKRQE